MKRRSHCRSFRRCIALGSVIVVSLLFGAPLCFANEESNKNASTVFDDISTNSCGHCVTFCSDLIAAADKEKESNTAYNASKTHKENVNFLENKIKSLQQSLALSESSRDGLQRQLHHKVELAQEEHETEKSDILVYKEKAQKLENEIVLLRNELEEYKNASLERMRAYRAKLVDISNMKNDLQVELLTTRRRLTEVGFAASTTRINMTLIADDVSNVAEKVWQTFSWCALMLGDAVSYLWQGLNNAFRHLALTLVHLIQSLYQVTIVAPITIVARTIRGLFDVLKQSARLLIKNACRHALYYMRHNASETLETDTKTNWFVGHLEYLESHSERAATRLAKGILVLVTVALCRCYAYNVFENRKKGTNQCRTEELGADVKETSEGAEEPWQ